MKRFFLLISLTLATVLVSNKIVGQETKSQLSSSNEQNSGKDEFVWQKNKFGDHWFFSIGSGAQMIFGKENSKGQFGSRITYAPSISWGKYFSRLFGIKLNFTGGSLHTFNTGTIGTYYRWDTDKNYMGKGFAGTPGYPVSTGADFQTWDPQWNYMGFQPLTDIVFQNGRYVWEPGTRGQAYMQTIHYGALNVNGIIDLSTWLAGYNYNRFFNLSLFGGPTIYHVFPNEGQTFNTGFGGNLGLHGSFKLNYYSSLFLEASGTLYPDKFDGHLTNSSELVTQVMAGVTFKLGKQRWDREFIDNGFDMHEMNENLNEMKKPRIMTLPERPEIKLTVNYFAPEQETVKKRNLTGEAYVIFETGKAVLLPNLANNAEELLKICKSIDYVKDELKIDIDKISLTGYASPDGSEALNNRLAENRAKALKDYIQVLYKFGNNTFKVSSAGENWSGLLKALETSHLTASEKLGIASIIQDNSNVTNRKNKIKTYDGGLVYNYLLTSIYPGLRRTDYKIDYTAPQFTVDEGKKLIFSKPSMLSQYEIYLVANSYKKGSGQFMRAMDVAYALYPEDEVANINVAAISLNKNDLEKAANSLLKFQASPKAYNNLGVYYAKHENFSEAEKYFKLAQENGSSEASANLETLKIIRAKMEKYYQDLDSYNKWLQETSEDSNSTQEAE